MRYHPVIATLLLGAILALSSCNARHDTDAHEREAHGGRPKPAPVAVPPSLRDTVQLLVQQLDTVRRIGCWDEDFARLMSVHHAGAQRLAAVEVSQGKDSSLRTLAQHVLKGHERDNHVLALALTREPPGGRAARSTGRAMPRTHLFAALPPRWPRCASCCPRRAPLTPTLPPSCKRTTKAAWPWPKRSWLSEKTPS